MKIIDLNLLIYAINQDAPNHEKAKEWWENCLSGTETIGRNSQEPIIIKLQYLF